jgi:hypothetical protein
MKIKILLLICVTLFSLSLSAKEFSNESLKYKVTYKWGMVQKQAGTAVLSLKNTDSKYIVKLAASSDPWADKFYKVRDTLNGEISKRGFLPMFYEKISHEGKEDKHDIVRYERVSAKTIGNCSRIAYNDGVLKKNETRKLEATGTTVDMLSSFYYMRNLAFESWQKGHVITINIFSGKQKELLTIRYLGVESVEYDNKKYDCHRISFIFTSDGKTKTSDDMDAWITTDSRRIPVKMVGKLKIGQVRCFYVGD